MVKKVNANAYVIIKKEENAIYDVLLCNACKQTCMRCNYSRHKNSPKHLRELEKSLIQTINPNTSHGEEDEKADKIMDDAEFLLQKEQ